ALEYHVERQPDRLTVFMYEEEKEFPLTYRALWTGALGYAAELTQAGLQPGQMVAIMLPTCKEYLYSFYGVLLAGGVPVPLYPPARLTTIEDHMTRHVGILKSAGATIMITIPEAKALAWLLRAQVESLRTVLVPADLAGSPSGFAPVRGKPGDIGFLQYTSGSTGSPKGVVLTHANLLVNLRSMGRALRVTPADVFVSWLPLYHDMGLIGAWMGSLTFGFKFPVMSPLTFLARPERWLRSIHRHGGTISGGPNFCYELCLRRIQDADMKGIDLSTWRLAFNGAEPVSPDTMAAFSRRFARFGFRPEAMTPVYGLAEATLGVAFPPPARGAKLDRVDKDRFMRGGEAVPVAPEHAEALTFVACGHPIPGHQIRVVDASGRELPERAEGHIQFSGPSVTSGYYRSPERTQELLHGEWMDTDDYGYVAEGEIYITGRIKDTIIRAGRNVHPYELEEAIGNLEGVRKGCVAVFGSPDRRSGTERVVVLAETREADAARRDALRDRISDLAVSLIGMPPDDIMLASPGTVLKTSSGKIRRLASREVYERGGATGTRAVWWQVVRLTWSALLPQARRSLRVVLDWLYGAYALLLLGVIGSLAWIACALARRTGWCWALSHGAGRLFLALARLPLAVRGLEHLPSGRPCIFVVNHQSYLDGPVLVSALRNPGSFVAKRELLDHWVPRIYLKRLGSEFVERFDVHRGVEDAGRFTDLARGGRSLIVFAEGTFRRMPGLLPFRMGAFVIAAQAGVPVIPVTLRGTRSILRDGQWLFRRGRIGVTFSAPIEPRGTGWNAAIQLRDATRAEILRLCGEPDLGEETALPPKNPQQRES
ncbi:MAG TPA: AMP-binding protein, partial [Burkholderiales bacterium]|nr:AMP-binding protein [Burkholderiales bacterium]